jgi:hypothetical protein
MLFVPLDVLERETGLSRHTILRARQGKRVHARSLELLTHMVRLAYGAFAITGSVVPHL